MRPSKPGKKDRKHPDVARDAMEDINEIHYMGPNRDRTLGEADRTGRHYDEDTGGAGEEGSAASRDHETD